MTMPHLMNCPHDDDGWCLTCVAAQHDKLEEAERLVEDAVARLKAVREELTLIGCTTPAEDEAIFRRAKALSPYGAPALEPPAPKPPMDVVVSPVVPEGEMWLVDAVTGKKLGRIKGQVLKEW